VCEIADVRYSDKKRLSRFDLYVDLFDRFNLKVTDVIPMRSIFLVLTDKGKKILKRIDYSVEELKFVYNGINYIRNSFDRVMDFVKTRDGEIYTFWKGDIYCILDLVEGRECEFANPIDVQIAARGIGELHLASEGFKSDIQDKNTLGRSIDIFSRKLEEIKFFKRLANFHEIKTEFDNIFLSNVDNYINEIENCIDVLKETSYLKLCSEEDKIVLCHHDLAHHNILINDEKAYFVDFDYAIIDLKVHDLCNFINKAIKNSAFDIKRANMIIENYCSSNSLDKRELEVLYALLTFPEDFYSISKDYYSRRKDWEEEVFFDRLIKKVEFKEDREEFLQQLCDQIKNLH
jgi:CotS family spore coat protein